MKADSTLTITTPTDRDVVLTRVFDAPANQLERGAWECYDKLAEVVSSMRAPGNAIA